MTNDKIIVELNELKETCNNIICVGDYIKDWKMIIEAGKLIRLVLTNQYQIINGKNINDDDETEKEKWAIDRQKFIDTIQSMPDDLKNKIYDYIDLS